MLSECIVICVHIVICIHQLIDQSDYLWLLQLVGVSAQHYFNPRLICLCVSNFIQLVMFY